MFNCILSLIQLARPRQWVKNFFVFFPLIFSGKFADEGLLFRAFLAFGAFCLAASSIYVVNDILDAKRDRLHPRKKCRPLAAKSVSIEWASVFGLVLCVFSLTVAFLLGNQFFVVLLAYLLSNIIYNLKAKHVVLLDGFFVAIGFLLRVWGGAYAVGVAPSVWLQLCVFLLALFLGFSKRRYELSALKEKAAEHRGVLVHYTSYLLDQIIMICSTLTIVFYGLYTISHDVIARVGYSMVYSLIFVIYGIFRYLYLLHVRQMGDDPGEVLFMDRSLVISVVLWMAFVFVLIYQH